VFIDLFAPEGHRSRARCHARAYRKEEQAKIEQASYKLVMKICCFVVAV